VVCLRGYGIHCRDASELSQQGKGLDRFLKLEKQMFLGKRVCPVQSAIRGALFQTATLTIALFEGKITVKFDPTPGVLLHSIEPPSTSTMALAIASPSPPL